jgi:hypothetical protein
MLKFTLARFQFVHPSETEKFETTRSTGMIDDKGKVIMDTIIQERRKRVPLIGAQVSIQCHNYNGKQQELRWDFDDNGYALCCVGQSQLPQSPMDADFEVRTPKGQHERGKVRVGGFEEVTVTEIVAG